MEDLRTIYNLLLSSDGIGQTDRLSTALEEKYVQLEDRSIPGLITHLHRLSKELIFLDKDGGINGDWSALFNRFLNNDLVPALQSEEEIGTTLAQIGNIEPHLALLLAFLKLHDFSRQSLNSITRKHLLYYYREVLKFGLLKGTEDKVHVIFELNKNAPAQLIRAGTILNAGKGADGQELQYKTTHDILVNQAKIASIKSVFAENFPSELSSILWSVEYDPLQLPEKIFPFGLPQHKVPLSERTMKYAATGLAFGSTMLNLEGGERRLFISLHSEAYLGIVPSFVDMAPFVRIELTGEKGWVQPFVVKAVIEKDLLNPQHAILNLELLLSEAIPGIYNYNEETHKAGFPIEVPVLRMISMPEIKLPAVFYSFRISDAEITVKVKGLKKLVVQNEEAVLSVKSPFALFGSSPVLGSRFYLGSNECFQKNLRQLTVNMIWKSPPADFTKYYAGYPIPPWFSHAEFKIDADILLNGTFEGHGLTNDYSIFDAGKKDFPMALAISNIDLKKANDGLEIQRANDLPDLTSGFVNGLQRGFIRLTLTGPEYEKFSAFGHSDFQQALSYAMQAIVNNPGIVIDLPQVPYTPQVKEISLDYTATDNVFIGSPDQIYHITPYGVRLLKNKGESMFPEFRDTGYLYIGLANLLPEQQVDLLFNIAENSSVEFENYISDYATPVIKWSYLAGENWVELRQDQVPINTTGELQQSGIIALQSGSDATLNHGPMPDGMIWLQAALVRGFNRVPPLNGIHAQAMDALLELRPGQKLDDYSMHLTTGLAPDSVKKNIAIAPSLKSIRQPYNSFGGVQPKTGDHFIKRLSERVRHRNRAVNSWDFERLTLEAFPAITKCKCLTGGEVEVPGTTVAIVIPKIDLRLSLTKRLQPRGNSFFLDQIRQYLTDHASFFTTVLVNNPDYEELLTDFKVKFKTGYDPVFYLALLNEEIVRFLSPWAFDERSALHFDTEIYRSEIIYFIENLPYVEYIADFKLFHLNVNGDPSKTVIGKMKIGKTFLVHKPPDPNIGGMTVGENFIVGIDWEVVSASFPSSILVSVPQHTITIVDESRICSGISALGIGSMVIKLDFIVSKS